MLQDITPKMTSNTTPAPYKVSASGTLNVDFAPWKAFSGTNTGGIDSWAGNSIACWIKFDFNKNTRIDAIMTQERDSTPNGTMPKEMILYGSNDDIFYEGVLTISNQILWSQAEGRIFKLDNAVSFRYYKLNVLENTGYSTSSVIGLIKFFQDDGKTEQITEKKASLNYCLPKNSTLAMNQRRNDLREGLLGFSNDPDDRYGTLYMVDNKGRAIIPKASMAEPDVLFDGVAGGVGEYSLAKSIDNYKHLIVIGGLVSGTQNTNTIIIPVEHQLLDMGQIARYTLGFYNNSNGTIYSWQIRFNFNTVTTLKIHDANIFSWVADVSISKIYGIK